MLKCWDAWIYGRAFRRHNDCWLVLQTNSDLDVGPEGAPLDKL